MKRPREQYDKDELLAVLTEYGLVNTGITTNEWMDDCFETFSSSRFFVDKLMQKHLGKRLNDGDRGDLMELMKISSTTTTVQKVLTCGLKTYVNFHSGALHRGHRLGSGSLL